jgi:hypothetical protein
LSIATLTEPTTRPAAFIYNPALPMPPEVGDSLEVLARIRGTVALEELKGAVDVLDAELKAVHRKMSGGAVRENLGRFQDAAERRRRYVARANALAKHLKVKPHAFAKAAELPDIVGIMGRSVDGQDLRGQLQTGFR